ncbi:polynucleotide 5'-hydroxyl-kinase NOL9-like [Ptychodera flava]|uniref:polynucleotide 5'-hydroxyl-kinase NOL9-like n=1 Tax=Ptychodera flava TaxID=63121 RepID=UPI00396A5EBB
MCGACTDSSNSRSHEHFSVSTFLSGTGLCLLLDVIRLVKPTQIVQFETRSQAKNLPFLDEEYLSENPGWCLPVESASENKSQLMVINVRSDHSFSGKFRAANQRDMILLAYPSQLQPEISRNVIKPMHHLTPYVLPWNSVAVHAVHCKVPERQIMYALNASIVALCVASNSQMEEAHTSTNKDFPVFFSETPVCQCLGFGVIRGIDMKKRCFYILTPVSSVKLPKVNTLLRGAMPIPNYILLKGEVDDQKPYLTSEFSYTITGAGAVKIRKNLLRKCIKLKGNIM